MHGDHYDPFLFTFLKFLRLRIYKKKDITPLKFLYIRTESLLLHGKNIKKELHSKGLTKKAFLLTISMTIFTKIRISIHCNDIII